MKTRLSHLRRQISSLRRQRRDARVLTGLSAAVLAILWVLASLFLLDWLFEMGRIERVATMLLGLAIIVWTARRFTLPWLGEKESDLDVALIVEQKQGIDSDLVAAIQFESPEAKEWGSPQLEDAVVDYVADFGRGWNILEGFTREKLTKRLILVGATVGLLGLAVVLFPSHARVFLSRLFLSGEHYPTDTSIEQIVINSRPVTLRSTDEPTATCPYGEPLRFQVICSGELPEQGQVTLASVNSGAETLIDLVPVENAAGFSGLGELAPGERIYSGELPRLIDTLDCQIYLGDAWTDPARLQVLPLPTVEARLTATPPSYAKIEAEQPAGNSRQLAVIEGSRVDVEIECKNKSLVAASIEIEDEKYPLLPTADTNRVWKLDVADTPLAVVDRALAYRITLEDEDGMSPVRPISGYIRLKSDRPPLVYGSVVTRHVLPTAKPSIGYRVADDYGLAGLTVHVQVAREGSEPADDRVVAIRDASGEPVAASALPLTDRFELDLSQFTLAKGDQLKLTLEATDYRGDRPGRSTLSEPLVLNVTDKSGLLSVLSEADQRSVRQIDAIIQRQLGIGEKP